MNVQSVTIKSVDPTVMQALSERVVSPKELDSSLATVSSNIQDVANQLSTLKTTVDALSTSVSEIHATYAALTVTDALGSRISTLEKNSLTLGTFQCSAVAKVSNLDSIEVISKPADSDWSSITGHDFIGANTNEYTCPAISNAGTTGFTSQNIPIIGTIIIEEIDIKQRVSTT